MKRHMALGVALAMMVASTGVEAQLRGLIKKKAEEVMGKKPEPTAKPAPAPAPAPTPETAAPAPAAPETPSGKPVAREATPAAAKTAVSPLDVSALPIRNSSVQVLRGRFNPKPNGDWDQLP